MPAPKRGEDRLFDCLDDAATMLVNLYEKRIEGIGLIKGIEEIEGFEAFEFDKIEGAFLDAMIHVAEALDIYKRQKGYEPIKVVPIKRPEPPRPAEAPAEPQAPEEGEEQP